MPQYILANRQYQVPVDWNQAIGAELPPDPRRAVYIDPLVDPNDPAQVLNKRGTELTAAVELYYKAITPLTYLSSINTRRWDEQYVIRDNRDTQPDRIADLVTVYNSMNQIERVPVGGSYTVPAFQVRATSTGPIEEYDIADGAVKVGTCLNTYVIRQFLECVLTAEPEPVRMQEPLEWAITKLREVTNDFNVVFVGKHAATEYAKIHLARDKNAVQKELNQEMIARGVTSTYYGARVIEVPDEAYPYDNLLAIGRGSSNVVFFGGPLTQQWTEDGVWQYLNRRDVGMAVHHINRVRLVEF
jgi:hypothetical protein